MFIGFCKICTIIIFFKKLLNIRIILWINVNTNSYLIRVKYFLKLPLLVSDIILFCPLIIIIFCVPFAVNISCAISIFYCTKIRACWRSIIILGTVSISKKCSCSVWVYLVPVTINSTLISIFRNSFTVYSVFSIYKSNIFLSAINYI